MTARGIAQVGAGPDTTVPIGGSVDESAKRGSPDSGRARSVAQTDVRREFARELHDIVSHALGAIVMQAGGARAISGGEQPWIEQALSTIEQCGRQAMVEVRQLVDAIRDDCDLADPLNRVGCSLSRLDTVLGITRACGVVVEVTVTGRPLPLPPLADHVAYRAVQECLTNVVKHAGRGTVASLTLAWSADSLEITISNARSVRLEPRLPSGGHGLRGLAERLELIGGRMTLRSDPERFSVTAEIPTAS